MAVEKGYRYKKGELLPIINCAPEQTKSKVLNERTDIYSLGAVLSNFLVKMIGLSSLRASVQGQKLEAVLSSMLADRPEDRPAQLLDVLGELKKIT
jgi:serine/threonine protein kinase